MLTGFPAADSAFAEGLDDWRFSLTNTLRVEDYEVHGNKLASPYRFTGAQSYNEFNLTFGNSKNPYDQWSGLIYGAINSSRYRSPYQGLVPERLNLTREKGDGAIPYRLEVGDYFGYFSFRTLQRTLKGAKLELQPQIESSQIRHSLIFITGANLPYWRDFTPARDYVNGVSWMMQSPEHWNLSLNLVHDSRSSNNSSGALHRSQVVYSIAGDAELPLGKQRLTLEGELAGFRGDHDGLTTPQSGQSHSDTGVFVQASGRSDIPLTYRLRFERNGQDFRPDGGVVMPDRQSVEAYLGWQFAAGLSIRGRAQAYRDGLETSAPTDTNTFGINLSGPFFKNVTGSLDAFVQDINKTDSSIDRRFYNLNANLSAMLAKDWNGRIGIFLQQLEDSVPASEDAAIQQYSVGVDHSFSMQGFRGSFSLGMLFRRISGGPSQGTDWSPALGLNLVKGPHQANLMFSLLSQNPSVVTSSDLTTSLAGMNYRYTKGQNTFGIEFNVEERRPLFSQHTNSCKVSGFWTYSLEKLPKHAAAGAVLTAASTSVTEGPLSGNISILPALAPGVEMAGLTSRLEAAGIRGGSLQSGTVVYEIRLMEQIEQRQRLVLLGESGRLAKSAVIVNFDDTGNSSGMAQNFERIRKVLMDRFGSPSATFEEGSFSTALASDLGSGKFMRIMEWGTSSGVIRFGIPRRLDGQVRMEIQHASSFGPPRDNRWSVEILQ